MDKRQLLHKFHDFPQGFIINNLTPGSFEKKLYAMYLSYLPNYWIRRNRIPTSSWL